MSSSGAAAHLWADFGTADDFTVVAFGPDRAGDRGHIAIGAAEGPRPGNSGGSLAAAIGPGGVEGGPGIEARLNLPKGLAVVSSHPSWVRLRT